jgi:hypothetical protein
MPTRFDRQRWTGDNSRGLIAPFFDDPVSARLLAELLLGQPAVVYRHGVTWYSAVENVSSCSSARA